MKICVVRVLGPAVANVRVNCGGGGWGQVKKGRRGNQVLGCLLAHLFIPYSSPFWVVLDALLVLLRDLRVRVESELRDESGNDTEDR